MKRAMVLIFAAVLALAPPPPAARAHDIPLTRTSVEFAEDGSFKVVLSFDVAAFVLGQEVGHLTEEDVEKLQELDDAAIAALIDAGRELIGQHLKIRFNSVPIDFVGDWPEPQTLRLAAVASAEMPASLPLVVRGVTPLNAQTFTITCPPELGPIVLTITREDAPPVHQVLRDGQSSWPFLLATGGQAIDADPWLRGTATAVQYLVLGFEHILPLGLDHILFVLGLFLLSTRTSALLWQVTAFTVAHTITLALSVYEIVRLPSEIVEPLIALSICYVAVENILTPKLHAWRPLVVFAFGLLHGMGFAGVLQELGLPREQFVTALISFNVGVELGQLAVIGLAFAAVGWFRGYRWYRPAIIIPVSAMIAAVGLFWTITRVMEGA